MDCSMPGLPVLQYLLEFTQTHVHESVMPSNYLILCHPLLPPSIFPSMRVFSNESALCIRWPSCWSFTFSIGPCNEYSGLTSFQNRLLWSPCSPRDSPESFPAPQVESISSSTPSFLYGPTLPSIHEYWKNHSFDCADICQDSEHRWLPQLCVWVTPCVTCACHMVLSSPPTWGLLVALKSMCAVGSMCLALWKVRFLFVFALFCWIVCQAPHVLVYYCLLNSEIGLFVFYCSGKFSELTDDFVFQFYFFNPNNRQHPDSQWRKRATQNMGELEGPPKELGSLNWKLGFKFPNVTCKVGK